MTYHFKFQYSTRVHEQLETVKPYLLLHNEEVDTGTGIVYCDIERKLDRNRFYFFLHCVDFEQGDNVSFPENIIEEIINDLTKNCYELDQEQDC